MLKAWDFTKTRPCQRYFDNNLGKIFQTNILQNGTTDTFDSCFNGQLMV